MEEYGKVELETKPESKNQLCHAVHEQDYYTNDMGGKLEGL